MDLKVFYNLEDLEFYLFKVLEISEEEKEIPNEYLEEEFKELFGWRRKIGKIIHIDEGKRIMVCNNDYYLDDKYEIKLGEVGDYCILETDGGDFTLLELSLPELKEAQKLWEKKNWDGIDDDDLKNNLLSKENLETIKEKRTREDEEKAERQEKEKEERMKKIEEIQEDFDKSGIFEDTSWGLKISGKSLKYDNFILEAEKNWKEIISYSNLQYRYNYRYDEERAFRTLLIDKEISFKFKKERNGIMTTLYEVKFGDKTTFNGERVAKAKVKFLINRLEESQYHDKKMISKYNKLSGMKADLIDLRDIYIYKRETRYGSSNTLKIPVSINLTDNDDILKLKCLDKEIHISWDNCKKYFYNSGGSRTIYDRFNLDRAFELMEIKLEDKVEKQRVYDYLKRITMLNNLDTDD